MSGPPRLSIHIGDYVKNTPPMMPHTWEHHGIYFAALFIAWNVPGCRLPVDELWLSRRFGCTLDLFQEKVAPIIAEYFKRRGNFWYQKYLSDEYDFVRKTSKKQSARAKSRWEKEKALSRGNAETMPESSRGNAPTPTPTPTQEQEESKKGVNQDSVVGKSGNGADRVTIKDPAERLARFQVSLATQIGQGGWEIVGAAADPAHAGHIAALAVCKRTAKEIGKGWPRQWPA